jgi:hypothetical protein
MITGMPFVESLVVIKEVIDAALTTKDLCDVISGARCVEMLETIGDVHVDAAARLLREARERQGEARREKFRQAIGPLEIAYATAAKRSVTGTWWRDASIDRALRDGCQVCLWLGLAYSALGNDPITVKDRLTAAKAFYSRWDKRERRRVDSQKHMHREPILAYVRSDAEKMAESISQDLDRERDSLYALADEILLLGSDSADLDNYPQPSTLNDTIVSVLIHHVGGKHRRRLG